MTLTKAPHTASHCIKKKLPNYFYDQFYSITTRYVSGKTDQDHVHVQHRTEHMKVTTKGRSVRITSSIFFQARKVNNKTY